MTNTSKVTYYFISILDAGKSDSEAKNLLYCRCYKAKMLYTQTLPNCLKKLEK